MLEARVVVDLRQSVYVCTGSGISTMRLLYILNTSNIISMKFLVGIAYIYIIVLDVERKPKRLRQVPFETIDSPEESSTHVCISDRKLLESGRTSVKSKLEGDPSYQSTNP